MIVDADPLVSTEVIAIIPETTAPRRGGGPRTPEGKEQSKRNALKHGLRAKVVLPEDLAAAVDARTAELAEEFEPRSSYEEWLVREMALATARIDRCAELSLADIVRGAERATLCWEADRRKAVEDLGARLPRDPARVRHALGRSKQGADWMIERWDGLGDCLRAAGGWDEAQRSLAFDLLGVPHELRNGSAKVPPEHDSAALAALVARQVARLREDQEAMLDQLDEAEQAMAAAGMPTDEDAASARLRKYEAGCRRALLWAQAEFRRVRAGAPHAAASGSPRPVTATPATTSPPLPDPIPPRAETPPPAEPEVADTPPPLLHRPTVAGVPLKDTSHLNRHERRAQERLARTSANRRA
jgi:hypothetical protein